MWPGLMVLLVMVVTYGFDWWFVYAVRCLFGVVIMVDVACVSLVGGCCVYCVGGWCGVRWFLCSFAVLGWALLLICLVVLLLWLGISSWC